MAAPVFEFAGFRLDCGRFELQRNGRSVRLERKPMELLILLVSREGQLVTRTEIAEHLWDKEVFVDTEHGINTAVRKIRQVLEDDPEEPRFVQTVTGLGYRFIGPLVKDEAGTEEVAAGSPAVAASTSPEVESERPRELAAQMPVASGRRRGAVWAGVAGLGVVAAILAVGRDGRGALGNWMSHRGAEPVVQSVAVLPLENLSGDAGQDYFADGMTDELITMLVKDSTLRVTSRTSVMQYKGVHRPLREIARELGVDGILEGSVERSGDHVHMTIQLIHAPTDTHVWAESYDRDASDVVSLPGEAAETIAKKVNRAAVQTAVAHYVNPAAHDAYLRGRYLWFAGWWNQDAGEYFRKATELQPDYAQGWAGLSVYYGAGAIGGDLNPADSVARQEATALKALQLDASLPEAHLAMCAAILDARWDWASADAECRRAIELEPGFAEAHHFRAKIFASLNRHAEAIEEQKKAMELDPFERTWALAFSYQLARQYDAAVAEAKQRLESTPNDPWLHGILTDTYRCKGMGKEATDELETMLALMGKKDSAASVREAYRRGGYTAVVLEQIAELKRQAKGQYVSPVKLAGLYAQLGRREETLSLLEEGYRQHSPLMLWVRCDPAFDFLQGDARYRAVIEGVGFPDA